MRVGRGRWWGLCEITAVSLLALASLSAAGKRAPEYAVHRARGKIVIDGRGDDAAWAAADKTALFRAARGSAAAPGETRARLLWDDEFLYVLIDAADADVSSPFSKHDDPLWRADAVELFIDADGSRSGYVELQTNPRGAVFDAWFPRTRKQGGKQGWTSSMSAAVNVEGTLDEPGDTDRAWHAELAIPLEDVKGGDAAMKVRVPPEVGDGWRLNIVRVDKPRQGKVIASSWAPVSMQDFHSIDRLLTVRFAE